MTGLIDGLEQDGLVVRTMDALDRRKLLIRITPAGEAKLDQVMPVYYRRVKALISVLPKRQLAGLQQSLKCLSEHTDLLK
jgi:DNA-binding MarR family transcriptional regulator